MVLVVVHGNVLPMGRHRVFITRAQVTWQYYEALNALGMRLLRLLALSLDLPAEHFTPMFTAPLVTLRPLHYAAEVSDPGAGVFGAGEA